jgi:2-polyprenyl-6-methoxyphenol hydroxylase-like FAD-dependent oxidoreductase
MCLNFSPLDRIMNVKLNYKDYVIWRGIAHDLENILPFGHFTETWGRGHRFGILPMGKKQICWYATANWDHKIELSSSPLSEIKRIFGQWHSPIPDILRHTDEKSIIRNEALDCKPQAGWSCSRVVLMGDSVHPTAPNLGQGGCMAIEDAFVLGKLLLLNIPYSRHLKYMKTYE